MPQPRGATRPATVSVVVVNYRGADDTIECVRSLGVLDWPAERLEVIVVDNASGGDEVARLTAALPDVTIVESPSNTGFAGGCNLGVAQASGDVVAFLNNDARPHPRWVRAAVEALENDPSIGCVASKVLDWDGERVDYVDGSLTWFGMGYKREVEQPDSPAYDTGRDVLFATGAAMFVRAQLFREVGGFDERFFMFYEDVDFGWRLNLLGHRVRYVPASLAFHKHHASIKNYGDFRESYLLERNALLAMFKNYGDDVLARVLPGAMALAVRRGISRADADATVLDLQRSPGGDDEPDITIPKLALTGAYAIDYLVEQLPSLIPDRERLQSERQRSDGDLMGLFRQPMEPAYAHPRYLKAYEQIVEAFAIEDAFSAKRRILLVTGEPLKREMAGPAIRVWEMAKLLSLEHDVTVATLSKVCQVEHPRFRTAVISSAQMRSIEQWADIIVFQGFLLENHPWLKTSKKIIVVDIYDPFHLEVLEQAKDLGPAARARAVRACTRALNEQLRRGDFFLCASQKQRDFWLGQLAAVGRLNPLTYDQDETMSALISAAPFGISDEVPVHKKSVVKGVVPGIGEGDKLILWGGGIYNWFDPLTLIRAIDRLRDRRPDVRLFFLGMRHPNPDVPEMRMAVAARELSDSLGLTDRFVFFNEGWVAYDERQNYLMEADVAVSCHLDHVETAFSFRTRILDYLWASVPIVATGGDTFGSLIEERRLGFTVPPEDVEALEEALFKLVDDAELAAECRRRLAETSAAFAWSRTLAPLLEFCRAPRRAPDLVGRLGDRISASRAPMRRPLRENVALARMYLREGGMRGLTVRAADHAKRSIAARITR